MSKLIAMGMTGLLGLLFGVLYPPPPPDGPPHPPEKGKRGGPGPKDDLRKAYDLLQRLRADEGPVGKPEARLRDWTERASRLYRKGVEAHEAGDRHLAHEYGASAHDLARATDHARNAARLDRPDPSLPPPPSEPGPEGSIERTRRDLRRAFDRITKAKEAKPAADSAFYLDAARDLYNAARRDAEAGRDERAGELARGAEAMTHVVDHLGHVERGEPSKPDPKGERPRPSPRDRVEDLPPPLDE